MTNANDAAVTTNAIIRKGEVAAFVRCYVWLTIVPVAVGLAVYFGG